MQATKAQTEGDLTLQWRMSTSAARHCLALGYHREEVVAAMPILKSSRVRRLFWSVYFLDRSLVLTLGRAPTIPDYDVDIEPSTISQDPGRKPWDESHQLFVDLSRIQAHIYEVLYSPAARRLASAERQSAVDKFSQQLAHWHGRWCQLDNSEIYDKEAFETIFVPVDVVYYSILTILHRAVSVTKSAKTIPPACYEAAAQSLRASAFVFSNYALAEPSKIALYAVW